MILKKKFAMSKRQYDFVRNPVCWITLSFILFNSSCSFHSMVDFFIENRSDNNITISYKYHWDTVVRVNTISQRTKLLFYSEELSERNVDISKIKSIPVLDLKICNHLGREYKKDERNSEYWDGYEDDSYGSLTLTVFKEDF